MLHSRFNVSVFILPMSWSQRKQSLASLKIHTKESRRLTLSLGERYGCALAHIAWFCQLPRWQLVYVQCKFVGEKTSLEETQAGGGGISSRGIWKRGYQGDSVSRAPLKSLQEVGIPEQLTTKKHIGKTSPHFRLWSSSLWLYLI